MKIRFAADFAISIWYFWLPKLLRSTRKQSEIFRSLNSAATTWWNSINVLSPTNFDWQSLKIQRVRAATECARPGEVREAAKDEWTQCFDVLTSRRLEVFSTTNFPHSRCAYAQKRDHRALWDLSSHIKIAIEKNVCVVWYFVCKINQVWPSSLHLCQQRVNQNSKLS